MDKIIATISFCVFVATIAASVLATIDNNKIKEEIQKAEREWNIIQSKKEEAKKILNECKLMNRRLDAVCPLDKPQSRACIAIRERIKEEME